MTETQPTDEVVFDLLKISQENAHATFLPPFVDLESHPSFNPLVSQFLNLFTGKQQQNVKCKKSEALNNLVKELETLGLQGRVLCKHLIIDHWEKLYR